MLGEAISMLVPQVVGFRLHGALPEGATATDLVLTVTQILRQTGVVGKFVEYFGHGLAGLPLADRATIGNMSPEYGATCGFFPVDDETLRYLRLTGRSPSSVELVEAYCKENVLWHDPRRAADLLAGRRARPLDGRAVARRAAPSAGPRPARERATPFSRRCRRFGVDRRQRRASTRRSSESHGRERRTGADRRPSSGGAARRADDRRRDGRARPRRRRDRRDHVAARTPPTRP